GWVDQTWLKEQHMTGLHYNPLTDKFKLAPGVDVNYMLHTTAKKRLTSSVILYNDLRDIMLRNSDLPLKKSALDQILNFFFLIIDISSRPYGTRT
ncbi:hypothetical protein HR12_16020, partial [Microbacterium sp. SUBG005]